jgi:putative oxidoreductase
MFHQQHVDAFKAKYNDLFYAVFRVVVGVLFMFHGLQKVFGFFTENGAQPILGGKMAFLGLNLMWVAGVIEFLGGLLIALGLFTAVAAFLSSVVMVAAFFISHFTLENPVPILNRGELALVYLAAFLFILFEGGGKYSLDFKLCKQCKANATPLAIRKKTA